MIRLPGVIDVHVHLREPGATQKETFSTGTKAAIAGGVTTILDMPNNLEPIVTTTLLSEKIKLANGKIYCNVGFHFAAHPRSIPDLKKVSQLIFAYKMYMNPTTGNLLVTSREAEEVMEAIPQNKIVIVHAEGETLKLAIKLAKKYKKRLHIAHVSLASEVKLISKVKNEGMKITCEVTPHHLFLTNIDQQTLGPFGIMKPPLQTKEDTLACWEGINDGTVDMIATDHAPHTMEEKQQSDKIPFGVPGVETLLPLLLTAVHNDKISLETLINITHNNPKKIFSIPTVKNTFVNIDSEEEYILSNNSIVSKSGWTPFSGVKIKGRIKEVFLNGGKVFNGYTVDNNPSGKIIKPVR